MSLSTTEKNRLYKLNEDRFDSIMKRTFYMAQRISKNYDERDNEYYRLLCLESTEELEFMVKLHLEDIFPRREETFQIMLAELTERKLLGDR